MKGYVLVSSLVILLLMCFIVPQTHALISNKNNLKVLEEINRAGPWIGLVTVYHPEENAFFSTRVFKPHPTHPFIDLSGRRFRIGTIHGRNIIYVRCGIGMLNAGVTTQMMADLFNVVGVLHFGIAGNANKSLSIGDVTVPKYVAYTGIWEWLQNPDSKEEEESVGHLIVGEYNIPQGKKQNLLGKISYQPNEFYSALGKANKPDFLLWFNTSSEWLSQAEKLKKMELSSCVNSTTCLPRKAEIILGSKALSEDIFVDNGAYREFLFKEFEVSSLDMESAAVVMTCLSNNLKVMVFRGLSDLAGAQKGDNTIAAFGSLAATNAIKAILEFIKILPKY